MSGLYGPERVVLTVTPERNDALYWPRCTVDKCWVRGIEAREGHPLDFAYRWARQHAIVLGHDVEIVGPEATA
jgi:hypothetical protein